MRACDNPLPACTRLSSTLIGSTGASTLPSWTRPALKASSWRGLRDEHLKLNVRQHSLANPNATLQDLRKTVLSWKSQMKDADTCSGIKPGVQCKTSSLESKIHDMSMEQNKHLAAQAESLRQQVEKVDSLLRPCRERKAMLRTKGEPQ